MNETTKRTELLILNVLTTQARTELKLDHEMDTPGDVSAFTCIYIYIYTHNYISVIFLTPVFAKSDEIHQNQVNPDGKIIRLHIPFFFLFLPFFSCSNPFYHAINLVKV
jgi:hypothetical protein